MDQDRGHRSRTTDQDHELEGTWQDTNILTRMPMQIRDRPIRSSSPNSVSDRSESEEEDGLPSFEDTLSSLGKISKDTTTSYYDSDSEVPLVLMDGARERHQGP